MRDVKKNGFWCLFASRVELPTKTTFVRPYSFALLDGSLEINVDIQHRVSSFIRGRDLLKDLESFFNHLFLLLPPVTAIGAKPALASSGCSYSMSVDDEPVVEMTGDTSKGSFDLGLLGLFRSIVMFPF